MKSLNLLSQRKFSEFFDATDRKDWGMGFSHLFEWEDMLSFMEEYSNRTKDDYYIVMDESHVFFMEAEYYDEMCDKDSGMKVLAFFQPDSY